MKRSSIPVLHTTILLALAGCLDELAPDVGPDIAATCNADSDPMREVSFRDQIMPIIENNCHKCHVPGEAGQQRSGLDLSTYSSLVAGGTNSVGTIVVPGKPCSSVLWQKVSPAPPFGARMPRGADPLTDADIALIHDWISEGALEN